MPHRNGKEDRLAAIAGLIKREPIDRQETLVDRLNALGYSVTQSSVSRDLQELSVSKVGGRYVVGGQPGLDIVGATPAGPNLLVIKTQVGAASLVGLRIDQAEHPEVIGTVAGDDTIFVATKSARAQRAFLAKLGVRA
jgi:transcriptional regulator of arginine metabolism